MSTNHNSAAMERILVMRLGSMGDVIHTLPAVAALRMRFPAAQIGWAIEERWAELLCAAGPGTKGYDEAKLQCPPSPEKPLVDRIHILNTRSWRSKPLSRNSWSQAWNAACGLRQVRYDLALDFQGAWKSTILALASGAPIRLGFSNPRERPAGMFYTRRVTAQGKHIIEQNVSLLSGLNPVAQAAQPETTGLAENSDSFDSIPAPALPLDRTNELWAEKELARRHLIEQDFAIINPGAGWGAKCWPPENYAQVALGLADCGVRSLINFGPGEEELAWAVETASRGAAQAVRHNISELIAITRRARIFVGGDTGPMHLAAALGVPVVAIFGPTDPERNGPYATEAVVLRNPNSVTNHSRRACADGSMLSITPAMVVSAARALLERTVARQEVRQEG